MLGGESDEDAGRDRTPDVAVAARVVDVLNVGADHQPFRDVVGVVQLVHLSLLHL